MNFTIFPKYGERQEKNSETNNEHNYFAGKKLKVFALARNKTNDT